MRTGRIIVAAAGVAMALGIGAVIAWGPSIASIADGAGSLQARPGRLVRLPDGRRINLRCEGAGAPTVLLEGGYEATSLAWARVQPAIARTNRVCAYDRAGLGFSDPGPLPRDGAAIARDLDQTLRAAGIRGPFVVVGHSAGGLYVRSFFQLRPRDVVGMVLVATSVRHQDTRFAQAFGPGAGSIETLRNRAQICLAAAQAGILPSPDPNLAPCTPSAKRGGNAAVAGERVAEARWASTWRTNLSEIDNLFTTTSDELDRGSQSYGDLPLVVLTADGAFDTIPSGSVRDAVKEVWARMHAQIAAMSTRGSARLIAHSGHMMIFDRPDAIITAIRDVIAAGKPGARQVKRKGSA